MEHETCGYTVELVEPDQLLSCRLERGDHEIHEDYGVQFMRLDNGLFAVREMVLVRP